MKRSSSSKPSKVYFADLTCKPHRGMLEKLGELFEQAGFGEIFGKKDLVAVKVHFGERGCTSFIPPIYARKVVQLIKEKGGRPFLTDAGTLYVGGRADAYEHILTAASHGYTLASVEAPVVIADGLIGHDFEEVEIEGKHFDKVKIAAAAVQADSLVALSHMTGHELTGFGAALKNVGMGLGSRGGKQQMHSDVKPQVKEEKCTGCARCLRWCSARAISLDRKRKKAKIREDLCLGCGECTIMCLEGAISIRFMTDPAAAAEKIAEYAYGALKEKRGKMGFFNFLMDMSPSCDCWDYSGQPFAPDIGILASTDIVAIDQASVDLINRAGEDLIKKLYPYVSWEVPLRHAEKLGLGTRKYQLVEV